MRKIKDSGAGRARARIVAASLAAMSACSLDEIPDEHRSAVESYLRQTANLARTAATKCAAALADEGATVKTSPATGDALASDMAVVEILVRCEPAESAAESAAEPTAERLFALPALRQAAQAGETSTPRMVYDSRVKPGDPEYERVHMPSIYSDVAASADIVAVAPIAGGGSVEVTVAVRL